MSSVKFSQTSENSERKIILDRNHMKKIIILCRNNSKFSTYKFGLMQCAAERICLVVIIVPAIISNVFTRFFI